jgi:hypothetical protein
VSLRFAQTHQRGQAALEALLIIIFGFILVLAIHHIGQLRSRTLYLLGESHYLSFVPAKKLDMTNNLGALSTGSQRIGVQNLSVSPATSTRVTEGYTGVRINDLPYGDQHRKIENQLGFDSTILLRASADSGATLRSRLPALGPIGQTLLVRHSFLLSGYGQAESTQTAQRQLASSAALWQQSFNRSRQLVSASALGQQSIDRPWDRPALTSDWLLPWADEVLAPRRFRQTSALKQAQTIPQFVNTLSK